MVEYRVLSDHIRLPTSILLPTFSILHKKPTNNLNSSTLTSTSNLHPIGKHPFNSHSSILLLLLIFLANTNTHPSQTKSTQINSSHIPNHLTSPHLLSNLPAHNQNVSLHPHHLRHHHRGPKPHPPAPRRSWYVHPPLPFTPLPKNLPKLT